MNKKRRNLIITLIVLLVLVGFVINLNNSLSVVSVRTFESTQILPIQTGEFNLDGYSGTYETTHLGAVSCSGTEGTYYCYAGTNNNIDKSDSFSNNIYDGKTLILTSSASGKDFYENYIKAKVTLPKGNITAKYSYSGTIQDTKASNEPPTVFFEVGDQKYSQLIQPRTTSFGESGEIDLILDKEQDIEFKITTTTHSYLDSSSNARLEIIFTPEINQTNPTPQNDNQNQTQESPVKVILSIIGVILLILALLWIYRKTWKTR